MLIEAFRTLNVDILHLKVAIFFCLLIIELLLKWLRFILHINFIILVIVYWYYWLLDSFRSIYFVLSLISLQLFISLNFCYFFLLVQYYLVLSKFIIVNLIIIINLWSEWYLLMHDLSILYKRMCLRILVIQILKLHLIITIIRRFNMLSMLINWIILVMSMIVVTIYSIKIVESRVKLWSMLWWSLNLNSLVIVIKIEWGTSLSVFLRLNYLVGNFITSI